MKKNTGLKAALITVCALLVVVAVLLVLVVTGVIGPNRDGGTGQTGASVTAGTSGTSASGETDTSGTGGTSEDTQTLYEVQVERHEEAYTLTGPDGQTETVFELTYEIPSVPEAPDAVRTQLDTFGEKVREDARTLLLNNGQMAYSSLFDEWAIFPWTHAQTVRVERADARVISFVSATDSYLGGAHGNVWFSGNNFDAESGREIAIDEIVTGYEALAEAIETEMKKHEDFTEVLEYYESDGGSMAAHLLENYMTGENGFSLPWTLTEDGLHVWFSDYTLGAYVFGARNIILPYESHAALFKDDSFFLKEQGGESMEARTKVQKNAKETLSLEDYCLNEGDLLLVDYAQIAGIYVSEEGKIFEVTDYATFTDFGDGGQETYGSLVATPGGYNLYTYGESGETEYGFMRQFDENAFLVELPHGSGTYYFSEEQTLLMQGGGREDGGEDDVADQNFRDSHGGYSKEELVDYVRGTMWAKDGDQKSAVLDLKADGTFIALEGMNGVVEATGTYAYQGDYSAHTPMPFQMYREDGSVFAGFEVVYSHQLQGEIILMFPGDVIYRQIQ